MGRDGSRPAQRPRRDADGPSPGWRSTWGVMDRGRPSGQGATLTALRLRWRSTWGVMDRGRPSAQDRGASGLRPAGRRVGSSPPSAQDRGVSGLRVHGPARSIHHPPHVKRQPGEGPSGHSVTIRPLTCSHEFTCQRPHAWKRPQFLGLKVTSTSVASNYKRIRLSNHRL
jgi:hypothetical protein